MSERFNLTANGTILTSQGKVNVTDDGRFTILDDRHGLGQGEGVITTKDGKVEYVSIFQRMGGGCGSSGAVCNLLGTRIYDTYYCGSEKLWPIHDFTSIFRASKIILRYES